MSKSGNYDLVVDVDKLEEERVKLKKAFLYVHNGLQNIDEALTNVEEKGIKGKSSENINELMDIVKSDVIAPSDRYNDMVIVNLNIAKFKFDEV
ncbi:hypothetical protein ACN6J9_00085 [Carnobacterium maltaromaticum]|uniref:hypothetical protein n=1 Tax=Carnobacterium maltaromaticum TaxID=2751 RepID=UPI000704A562|nr:hypothetical protein [Carnobacterium maltaromaticum]KRN73898.1 hypothetical protein IV76_GL000017 [Carnobacterium maltaromaticum]MBC9810675.1 hypothetical protein [Carnobacterium maltaromaticum]CAD5900710.1 conserved hypothetical protein [Carnobacterium maltaromaticum]CRH18378.1 hypothetical protein CM318V1_220017 [Carnobacterium maltaromaticum]CRH22425.1 hypothetical protein BN1423_340018 [Carnobacterium maltaromaticum]